MKANLYSFLQFLGIIAVWGLFKSFDINIYIICSIIILVGLLNLWIVKKYTGKIKYLHTLFTTEWSVAGVLLVYTVWQSNLSFLWFSIFMVFILANVISSSLLLRKQATAEKDVQAV